MKDPFIYVVTSNKKFLEAFDSENIANIKVKNRSEEFSSESVRCDKLRFSTYEQYKEKGYDFKYISQYQVIG